jgi:hypothetical protein
LRDFAHSCRKTTQWKEWHEGDAILRQLVNQSVIHAMREVVVVLDADDIGELVTLCELFSRDVAEADVPDQPFCLKVC